jgi:hypothetical protein
MSKPRYQPRSLEECLAADSGLARVSAHAQRLLKFQRIFEAATPLARQARIANLRSGRIIIHTTNGAVATKLRQLEPRLVTLFDKNAIQLTGIDVRLQAGKEVQPKNRLQNRSGIGIKQKQGLKSLADGLPKDSSLGAAIHRLVSQAK